MTKNRKMVRVLDIEEFEQNKHALMHFEKNMVELGGIKGHLTDSKLLQLMSHTCASVWGNGRDLYLASQERTIKMIHSLAMAQVDDCVSEAVRALSEWLELKITYERRGSKFTFRFQKANGETRELQLPLRRPEPPQQYPVN